MTVIATLITLVLILGVSSWFMLPYGRAAPTTWTFMVYLDADNSLEEFGVNDFMKMSSVGSTSQVNVVVQFDRIPTYDSRYGDWSDCKRFVVTEGMEPTDASAIEDLGEVNMGAQSTLVDFVDWAIGSYPADRYVLVLWDHGDNFYGVCWDDTSSGDHLSLAEVDGALGQIYSDNSLLTLDVLGFDTCFSGTAEFTYQVNPDIAFQHADYMIAAESYVPDYGWNYSGSLAALTSDPEMSVLEFCDEVLDSYRNYYMSMLGTPDEEQLNYTFTMSIVDLATLDPLVLAIDNLADDMIANMEKWVNHIALARDLCEEYGEVPWNRTVDLSDFAEKLYQVLPDPLIRVDVTSLRSALNQTIVNETHGMNPANRTLVAENASGLSIYFPYNSLSYDIYYDIVPDFKFGAATSWNEFLRAFYLEDNQHNPTVMSVSPTGDSAAPDSVIEVWFSEPMDYDSLVAAFSTDPLLSGTLVWIASENKLEFHPDVELAPSTTYTVTMLTDSTDLDGHHLKVAYQWQFTTRGTEIPEFETIMFPVLSLAAIFIVIRRKKGQSHNRGPGSESG